MTLNALAPSSVSDVTALSPVALTTVFAAPPVTLNATLGRAGMWTGEGPPDTIVGANVGDEYLDTITGDIYRLN